MPDRFEAQRRTILSASMIWIKGRVQREGEVIRIIMDRVEVYAQMLASVGETEFPRRTGPGDGAAHAGTPDARGAWMQKPRDQYRAPFHTGADPEEVVKVKTRDFR